MMLMGSDRRVSAFLGWICFRGLVVRRSQSVPRVQNDEPRYRGEKASQGKPRRYEETKRVVLSSDLEEREAGQTGKRGK